MTNSASIARDFSKAAPHYEDHAALQRMVARRCAALVNTHLMPKCTPNPTILDAGCGTGFLAEDVQDATIIQLDIAEGMARAASRHNHPTLTADINQMPLSAEHIHIIHSSLCMQWVHDLQSAFAECHRVLQDNGYFIFSTLEMGSSHELATCFAHATGTARTLPFRHHTTYLNALEDAGFAPIHTEQTPVVERYDTPRDVMKNLKSIGANNKQSSSLTPSQLRKAEEFYTQHYPHPGGGVTSSYRVLTVIAQK